MVQNNKLKLAKDSSVAIGIVTREERYPMGIFGSGFFIDSGVVITAKHVLDDCECQIKKIYKQQEKECELAVFSVVAGSISSDIRVMHCVKTYDLGTTIQKNNYPGPIGLDIDIGIIIPGEGIEDMGDIKHLEIKDVHSNLSLYGDVVICGYPSGDQSFDMFKNHIGLRLSPIIQFGHVTGFMPTDVSQYPWGLQTDIIGTGGSSGSPMLDPYDGKVMGMAQNVLAGVVVDPIPRLHRRKKRTEATSFLGWAKIGLTYGVSFYQFHSVLDEIKNILK